jgi:GR25 family glycosyltransferase involved in LPS biosynthesis
MYLNKHLQNLDVVCINSAKRKDRKTRMKLQCKNKGINPRYFIAKPHNDPKRGCLESHLYVIEDAIKRNKSKYLFVLEDDAKIIRDLKPFPNPPL